MTRTACASLAKAAMLTIVAALLLTVLIPSQADADEGFISYVGPCPNFSVQDVTSDPNGDWDHDGRTNSDELYGGTKPCFNESGVMHHTVYTSGHEPYIVCPSTGCYVTLRRVHVATNTHSHTNSRGNVYSHSHGYYTHHTATHSVAVCNGTRWNRVGVNNNPNGDADRDGISNIHEVNAGANPCARPCNSPQAVDYRLNPHGDWDGDGYTNNHEWVNRTNACSNRSFNPCPKVPHHALQYMPSADWDRDGTHNQHDPSPCIKNRRVVTYVPHTTYVPQVTYVPAPRPVPAVHCPHGYPHYHPGTGKCYANPIGSY